MAQRKGSKPAYKNGEAARKTEWEIAWDRAQTDDEFYEALKLAGPAIVEVQSPMPAMSDQLEAHPNFRNLCEQLGPKLKGVQRDPVWLLRWFVPVALDPPLDELMTRSERELAAQRLIRHASGLRECLQQLMQVNGSFCFPIQPMLSRFAVLAAAKDYLTWKEVAGEMDVEEVVHRTRFAIYRAVNDYMGELLLALEDAAEMFASADAKVQRPNNQNARRLYFLRYMTSVLHRETGKPCRNIVLSLASMYFDCEDLDEAALSKLAPLKAESKRKKTRNRSG